MRTRVSLINQVTVVGQQHETFGLQAGLLVLRMLVKLTRITPVLLSNMAFVAKADIFNRTA